MKLCKTTKKNTFQQFVNVYCFDELEANASAVVINYVCFINSVNVNSSDAILNPNCKFSSHVFYVKIAFEYIYAYISEKVIHHRKYDSLNEYND